MLLLLVLCLWITASAQNSDYSWMTEVPAEGTTAIHCGSYSTTPIPLMLKLKMEEHNNDSWVVVMLTPIVLTLDTDIPYLLVTPDDNMNTSNNYSCSVDNIVSNVTLERTELSDLGSEEKEWVFCNTSKKWTSLMWSKGDEMIAMVHRAEIWLDVMAERNGSSISITSKIAEDPGNYSCLTGVVTVKKLNATCEWMTVPSISDWQLFMEKRYWIIVVVVLSCMLLCSLLLGCFVCIKRRRRVRRQAKSRFFKVSTATRNLYTDSVNPDTDVANKDQDFTYQNVKPVSDDQYSDKSSFLSMGGDSYLEPIAEGGDRVSDAGDCYESPTPDDHEDSLDGDCYENTNEEIKDGSEGSQSYEDMKGSVCVPMIMEASPEEGITQDEDADSYENMQTPLYTQLNRLINPPHKSTEEAEDRKASLVDPTHQHPWKVSTLQQQNGDFYLSYESKKL